MPTPKINTRGETLFPGITRHAKILQTNRSHLNLVLKGERRSVNLLSRYKALLKTEGRPIPTDLNIRKG